MSLIITTLESDLGSFKVIKEYMVIGQAVQHALSTPITSINVLVTEQEKYNELPGNQIIKLAEDMIRGDVKDHFNGGFSVFITNITLLTPNPNPQEVFVSADAYTNDHKIISYNTYNLDTTLNWTTNMDVITNEVYTSLLNQMSLKSNNLDMQTFGVNFNCFSPL